MAAKTNIDAATILYGIVVNSILMTDAQKPNGKVYLFQRPVDSTKEDVVINTLPLDREAIQQGYLNVNIYVPNRAYTDPVTNVTDTSLPNTKRMDYLSGLAQQALGEVWAPSGEYSYEIESDQILQDENQQHFINVRLRFFSQTLNN